MIDTRRIPLRLRGLPTLPRQPRHHVVEMMGRGGLDETVAQTYGPLGVDVALVGTTGKVLLTNSASAILHSLASSSVSGSGVGSAMGPLLGQVARHTKYTGDGGTTLFLLAGAVTREIERAAGPEPCRRAQLGLQVSRLVPDLLPRLRSLCRAVPALPADLTDPSSPVRQAVAALVRTSLSGKVPSKVVHHLTGLVSQWLGSLDVRPGATFEDVAVAMGGGRGRTGGRNGGGVLDPIPIVSVPGSAVSESFVVPGCDCLLPCSVPSALAAVQHVGEEGGQPGAQTVTFVVAECALSPLEASTYLGCGAEGTVVVSSGRDAARNGPACSTFLEERASRLALALSGVSVDVLLCTQPLPDSVVEACAQRCIMVVGNIDQGDSAVLCRMAGVSAIGSLEEAVSLDPSCCGTLLGRCTRIGYRHIGGRNLLQLSGLRPAPRQSAPRLAQPQLVLRGPTAGLCTQYRHLLCRAARMVRLWFESVQCADNDDDDDGNGRSRTTRLMHPPPREMPCRSCGTVGLVHQTGRTVHRARPTSVVASAAGTAGPAAALLPRLKRCSGCRRAYYCRTLCQKRHWASGHRHECPTAANLAVLPGAAAVDLALHRALSAPLPPSPPHHGPHSTAAARQCLAAAFLRVARALVAPSMEGSTAAKATRTPPSCSVPASGAVGLVVRDATLFSVVRALAAQDSTAPPLGLVHVASTQSHRADLDTVPAAAALRLDDPCTYGVIESFESRWEGLCCLAGVLATNLRIDGVVPVKTIPGGDQDSADEETSFSDTTDGDGNGDDEEFN